MPSARSAAARTRRASTTAPTRRLSGPRRLARAPRPRVRWDRVGRVSLLIVLVIVAGLYVQHALGYMAVRAQLHRQSAIVQRLERSNAALEGQQRQLNDPAWILRDARRLGMVRPGERSYVISGLPNK